MVNRLAVAGGRAFGAGLLRVNTKIIFHPLEIKIPVPMPNAILSVVLSFTARVVWLQLHFVREEIDGGLFVVVEPMVG